MRAFRVYIAGPVGANDEGRPARLLAGRTAWRACVAAGFSPLAQWFFTAAEPGADELVSRREWLAIDVAWLPFADVVYCIPGESAGADAEVAEARRLGIPVVTSFDELVNWRDIYERLAEEAEDDEAAREEGLRAHRLRLREAERRFSDGDATIEEVQNRRVELRLAERAARKAREATL